MSEMENTSYINKELITRKTPALNFGHNKKNQKKKKVKYCPNKKYI